jgi:NAD(P)-dependent dehydrogenase (short-subunit alcohol dehydrogenase family)
MSTPEGRKKDGFETQFGTNYLAHFLPFTLLKDTLLLSSTTDFNSRAVILSSVAHRFAEPDFDNLNMDGAYDSGIAYGRSKTCNLWTANEIERRYGAKGLHAFSVHQGGIATDLMRHLSEEEKGPILKDEYLMKVFKSPEQGAATTVWGAVSKDLEGKGGRYLEDCQIARAWGPDDGFWGPGYATWAYGEVKEGRLWKKSSELVGLEDES